MSKVTDLFIDGDIFVADGGGIVRFVGGKSEGWQIEPAGSASFAPGATSSSAPRRATR